MTVVGDVPWALHDERLMEYWVDPSLELEDIANKLGRSLAATKTRASRLQLPKRITNRQLARLYGVSIEDLPSVTDAVHPKISEMAAGGELVRCLSQISESCMGHFRSPDKTRIRTCPRCKESQEYEGAASLPDGSL